jgi:hypothetical protein
VTDVNARGFSLLEFAVAMAVSLAVLSMAIVLLVQIGHALNTAETAAKVDANAKVLIDMLVTRTQGIGGYGIRPHAAISVERQGCLARGPLPPCGNADRMTLVVTSADDPVVNVTRPTATTLSTTATCGAADNVCCFVQDDDGNAVSYVDRTLFLWQADGSSYQPVKSTTLAGCTLSFTEVADLAPDLTVAGFTAGTLHAVRVETYYLDEAAGSLVHWVDADLDNAFGADESSVLARGVLDFQLALGFDVDGDGVVADDGTVDDEWLGNAAADTFGSGGLAGADRVDLRLGAFGVVIGQRAPYAETMTASVLDGLPVSLDRRVIRANLGQALFRNLNIFF